jgi:hypothetical protein
MNDAFRIAHLVGFVQQANDLPVRDESIGPLHWRQKSEPVGPLVDDGGVFVLITAAQGCRGEVSDIASQKQARRA